MDYMEIFEEGMKKKEFTHESIRKIQQGIKDAFDGISNSLNDAENHHIESIAEADTIEMRMRSNGYEPQDVNPEEMDDLPAYVNAGNTHPDDIRKMAEEDREREIGNCEEDKKELFENVFKIGRTNMKDIHTYFNYDNRRRAEYGSSLIVTPDVLKYLGDEYREYFDKRFEEEIQRVRDEHAIDKNTDFTPATDEDMKSVNEAFNEGIDKSKIFSTEYANTICDISNEKHMAAKDEVGCYDSIYDSLKESSLNLTSDELDFVTEIATIGTYNKERDAFLGKDYCGTKFDVKQNTVCKDNVGKKLCDKVDDISESIGDAVGAPDGFNPSLVISPKGSKGFTVAYPNTHIINNPKYVKDAVFDEISNLGYSVSDFSCGEFEPVSTKELDTIIKSFANNTYGTSRDEKIAGYLTKESANEIKHAEKVMANGFNKDGYNTDGFDETGHSADGDYNPMYDKAFTDQGPDF